VADGYHLWAQRFDRELQDIFDVQDELARAIVQVLKVRMTTKQERRLAQPIAGNLEAYELCLKGRYYLYTQTAEGLTRSIECFDQACRDDPACAEAYAGLARARCWLSALGYARPREVMPQARAEALRALAIDDTFARAHESLAWVRHWYEWDWRGAEAEYKRALDLNPADAESWVRYAEFCAYMGREEDSIGLATRAMKMQPVSLQIRRTLALILIWARRFEEALAQCREIVELDPNYFTGHLYVGLAHAGRGRYCEALEALDRAQQLAPPEYVQITSSLAWVRAMAGRTTASRAILTKSLGQREDNYFSPFWLACICAGLGEAD
jgi:serine/threonine-protein kinase